MGKFISVDQIQAEMLKDAKSILNRTLKLVKDSGGAVGYSEASIYQGQAVVTLECNLGAICLLIKDAMKKERLEVVQEEEFGGQYDWAADHYMKPSGTVFFKRI